MVKVLLSQYGFFGEVLTRTEDAPEDAPEDVAGANQDETVAKVKSSKGAPADRTEDAEVVCGAAAPEDVACANQDETVAKVRSRKEASADFEALSDKHVLIHDSDGEPLGCAPLKEAPHTEAAKFLRAEIDIYPEYTGDFTVSGDVTLTHFVHGTGVYSILRYTLDGSHSQCGMPGPAPNSCGVHVR